MRSVSVKAAPPAETGAASRRAPSGEGACPIAPCARSVLFPAARPTFPVCESPTAKTSRPVPREIEHRQRERCQRRTFFAVRNDLHGLPRQAPCHAHRRMKIAAHGNAAAIPNARNARADFRASVSGGPNKLWFRQCRCTRRTCLAASPLRSSTRGENRPRIRADARVAASSLCERAGGDAGKVSTSTCVMPRTTPSDRAFAIKRADLLQWRLAFHHHARLLAQLRPQAKQCLRGKLRRIEAGIQFSTASSSRTRPCCLALPVCGVHALRRLAQRNHICLRRP